MSSYRFLVQRVTMGLKGDPEMVNEDGLESNLVGKQWSCQSATA